MRLGSIGCVTVRVVTAVKVVTVVTAARSARDTSCWYRYETTGRQDMRQVREEWWSLASLEECERQPLSLQNMLLLTRESEG